MHEIEVSPQTMRHLTAAEGYLDLGMAEHALEELQSVEPAGPFEAVACLMKGKAFTLQERYDNAITQLQRAAEIIPAPDNRDIWLWLSECYRRHGREDLAEEAARHVENPPPREERPTGPLDIQIRIEPVKSPGQPGAGGPEPPGR